MGLEVPAELEGMAGPAASMFSAAYRFPEGAVALGAPGAMALTAALVAWAESVAVGARVSAFLQPRW